MRLSAEHLCDAATPAPAPAVASDPMAPDISFLARDPATALQSFFATIDRMTSDNPVAIPRLQELAGKARLGQITAPEGQELQGAEAPGGPPGACRRRRHRVLPEAQALSDAGRDPKEGQAVSAGVWPRARRRGRGRSESARARSGVHGRPLWGRDDEGDDAFTQRRIHYFHSEHRRQRLRTSPTSACSRRSATGTMPSGLLTSSTRTACAGWVLLLGPPGRVVLRPWTSCKPSHGMSRSRSVTNTSVSRSRRSRVRSS